MKARSLLVPFLAPLLAALPLAPSSAEAASPCRGGWVAGWASSQMLPTGENALPAGSLGGRTLRQVVRLSLDGAKVRVRLSNLAGNAPLHIIGASLARPRATAPGAIDTATIQPLRFDGQADVTIPAGADYLSDPVTLPVKAFDDLAISIRYDEEPSAQTSHPGSRATSWLLAGDHLATPDMTGATSFEHWFTLAAVEVENCASSSVVVALGDSITDGLGSTPNGNDRWTDGLVRRLQADPKRRHLAVVNQGIGGNRLLKDGLGPNALARLDRDVLAQPGVRTLILLEGINDIGTLTRDAPASEEAHDRLVARMIGAYGQIIERAHGRGIRVIGGTILPFVGNAYYHPAARSEADRQAVNRWIRESGAFDAVVDFDKVMRDPARPDRLLPRYDMGDYLHPSPAGYRAMAEAIPLDLLR